MSNSEKIEAVDIFCGAGGLTCGLQKAGVNVLLGIDVDPICKFPFEHNNKAECEISDISKISSNFIAKKFKSEIKLLAGCAPCQTFSSYNQKASSEDSRWWLLREFIRLVDEVNPELITMENVPGLLEHDP